jgi:hypothetical protein
MNGLCCVPLFVIPSEDPGSSVEHCLLQRPAVHCGFRLKAGVTERKGRDNKEKIQTSPCLIMKHQAEV